VFDDDRTNDVARNREIEALHHRPVELLASDLPLLMSDRRSIQDCVFANLNVGTRKGEGTTRQDHCLTAPSHG
jgi:hypothetical protein